MEGRIELAISSIKPKLRGWLHFGAAPVALVLGLALMVITPTVGMRIAVAVYVITTVMLFGVSAAYHLGVGSRNVNGYLRQLDHANIYLFIAGSYTPLASSLKDTRLGWIILSLVWSIGVSGMILPIAWLHAPRWITAGSYIALGWVAIFFMPAFYTAFGLASISLLGLGGLFYTIGGVIYARKHPNPFPQWFGFHELFHAFTIAAYLVHYAVMAVVVLGHGSKE